jgi:amino-acid N-acetyltransferase
MSRETSGGRIRIVTATRADDDRIMALLSQHGLPTAGIRDHVQHAFVARSDDRIVGVAALELYPDGGLLRSVVVSTECRGAGLARALVERVIALARAQGLPAIYLLTETAAEYFSRLGFVSVSRSEIPLGVQQSIEFTSACPSTAAAMMLRL